MDDLDAEFALFQAEIAATEAEVVGNEVGHGVGCCMKFFSVDATTNKNRKRRAMLNQMESCHHQQFLFHWYECKPKP